jgi:hypothetical protein
MVDRSVNEQRKLRRASAPLIGYVRCSADAQDVIAQTTNGAA